MKISKIFNRTFAKKELKSGNITFLQKNDSYLNSDGSFDYEKYRKRQEEGNKRKIDTVWVLEENIRFLSDFLMENLDEPKFGICHGTRRGKEQEWFNKYLGCQVIGTEISETAMQFPNTIQWDFHKIKDEWLDNVDFIYSNSFDHSHDPELCINNWMKCLKPEGICILEHTDLHGVRGVTDLDPFGAELIIMPYLILEWGKGSFSVRKILDAPIKRDDVSTINFIVIKKNK